MPLDSVDYRSACGQHEACKNRKSTDKSTQRLLNHIAAAQQHHVPERCSALSLLYLSSLILPNIRLVFPDTTVPETASAIAAMPNNTGAVARAGTPLTARIDAIVPLPLPIASPNTPSPRTFGFVFPQAQAATLPTLDVIERNVEEDTLIAAGDDGKRLLLNLAKSFLINLGNMSVPQINKIEFRWQQLSANAPITLAHSVTTEVLPRDKRISFANRNKQITAHIKENCGIEAEIYNPDGSKEGEILMFTAQRIDNPFRMLYDDIPDYTPSGVVVFAGKTGNLLTDILTLGLKPLAASYLANHYRKKYYTLLGDPICVERQSHINFANFATALDVGGLQFSAAKNIIRKKPIELSKLVPHKNDATYVIRNKQSNIENGISITAKPKGSAADNDKVVLSPKGDKEFETMYQSREGSVKEKKRVVFNEEEKIWCFADDETATPLDLKVEEGDNFITLYGEKYRLRLDDKQQFEIAANDLEGIERHFSVYQNPLSGLWHLRRINGHPAYTFTEQQLIAHLKVELSSDLHYTAIPALNPDIYGSAVLFEVRNQREPLTTAPPLYLAIEMNGALVPARTALMQGYGIRYSVYDLKSPLKSGYRLEWNGERWRMEQWSSPHVSKALNELVTSSMFATDVPRRRLSVADNRGLFRADERSFMKIRGNYVEVHEGLITRIGPADGSQIPVHYKDAKFQPLSQQATKERSRSITSQELAAKFKEMTKDHVHSNLKTFDIEHLVRTLVVKSSVAQAKSGVVSDAVNATITKFKYERKKIPVEVDSISSTNVNMKRYIVRLGADDYFFVDISLDGRIVNVLIDDEETLAMDKHRKSLSGGDIDFVAALRRDEETPVIRPSTRSQIDAEARRQIEVGAALLREALDKMNSASPQNKSLIVGHADFFKTSTFENNVFSSPHSAYEAMIDMLIPLSRQYPNAIIIPGSVYVSQDIPQYLRQSALHYQQGNHVRNLGNIVNLSAVMVPVLYKGRFVAMPRKGEHLHFKKRNALPEQPATLLTTLDEIPWGATLIASNTDKAMKTYPLEHEGARTGTIFVGKTLFPGEQAKADWFFCPCPETNGTRGVENFFSNEFMIDDDKFLLVVEDEFIQHGNTRPIVRTNAYPEVENATDVNRYDWIIHCAASKSLDETMRAAGYNFIEAGTAEGGEFFSEVHPRPHLVSYSPEKKLTLYEFLKD